MSKIHRLNVTYVIAFVSLLLGLVPGATTVQAVGISPTTVTELVFPGEYVDVTKTVETPAIPPKPDIYFLADTTASMTPAIVQVQADAAAVLTSIAGQTTDPRFGAGDYKDFLSGDPYAFNPAAPIPAANDAGAAALAAIAGWSVSGGGDGSEGQFFALDRIANSAANFRTDSTRIVVWFGDAPAHDPVCAAANGLGYDITEASVTAALVAAEIRVIAISLDTDFYTTGLNDDPTLNAGNYGSTCPIGGSSGQAARIATATGGVSLTGVAPEGITAAILAGLGNLPAEVAMVSDCAAPLTTTFTPASQTVTSGDNAQFNERISVAAGAAGGTYSCRDWALINGQPLTNDVGEIIYETKTIHVPGIDLQPPTATNELQPGASHTLIATVSAGAFGPVANVRVEFEIVSGPNTGQTGSGFTDAAGSVIFTYPATQGPAGLGQDLIVARMTDGGDTVVYSEDTATKDWVDTTPPVAACTPTTNPHGKNVPNAPGQGGKGQNQDGFYALSAEDAVWPADSLQIFVTDTGSGTVFGPFSVGTRIKYTQAPGAKPEQKPIGSGNGQAGAVAWHITGKGDASVTAVDGSGNVSAGVSCLVPPPPQ